MDNNNGLSTATIPSEQGAAEVSVPECDESRLQDDTFCLPVKFNKQDYHLNLEEATRYAQKGMKFDEVEPMLGQLKTLAQQHGLGVRELVEVLCENPEEATLSSEDQGSVEERMAAEFCELRQECPDAPDFNTLPTSVIQTAITEGIPLLDAYLRYDYRERMRVTAANTAARKASEASAGAQRSELQAAPDPAVEAMLVGVRGR